jgi:cytochrome c peroxidase
MKLHVLFVACVVFILGACAEKDEEIPLGLSNIQVPQGFPELPESIRKSITDARIALGKKLFYDTQLSADNSISCSSCHHPEKAFAEPTALSTGMGSKKGFRNTQALFNLAWKPHFFRDGGVDLLKLAAMNPIQNPNEMGTSIKAIVLKLRSDENYVSAFNLAYGDTVSAEHILHALECFQVSLISGNSRFDQWKNGNPTALSEQELRGKDLFFSTRTNCSACHGGFNFDSRAFRCNGFFEVYPDSGRQRITMEMTDRGRFAVPSLRNCAVTAPYMHDGSVTSLEEIVRKYASGGSGYFNQDSLVKPLGLTENEIEDLVAFLQSLTDESFLSNAQHKP